MSKETIMVDYPLPGRYDIKDTEWVIFPDEHDPGVLGSKLGARPFNIEEENDST